MKSHALRSVNAHWPNLYLLLSSLGPSQIFILALNMLELETYLGTFLDFAEAKGQRLAGGALQLDHPSCCHMEEYTLCCFVPGAKDTFPVDINEGMTVGQLKKAIKNEKPIAFKDVDAADLTLHQINVDISNESEYDNIMRDVSQPGYVFILKRKLRAAWRISQYFGKESARPENAIHILVELPQSKSIDPWACGAVAQTLVHMADAPQMLSLTQPPPLDCICPFILLRSDTTTPVLCLTFIAQFSILDHRYRLSCVAPPLPTLASYPDVYSSAAGAVKNAARRSSSCACASVPPSRSLLPPAPRMFGDAWRRARNRARRSGGEDKER